MDFSVTDGIDTSSSSQRVMSFNFNSEVLQMINETVTQLNTTWDKLGIFEEAREERLVSLLGHHRELQQQMIEEECNLVQNTEIQITKLLEDLEVLKTQLHLFSDNNDVPNEPLLQKRVFLVKRIEELVQMKEARERRYQDLLSKHKDLCFALDEPHHYMKDEITVPSEECLYEMEQNIECLKKEQSLREITCLNLKAEIFSLSGKIDLDPENQFQKDFLYKKTGLFLSKQNLEMASDWLNELKDKYVKNRSKVKEMESRLTLLWDCFCIDHYDREHFFTNNSGYTEQTMKALQAEIDRLETERSFNLECLIQNLRIELASLWDKCHVSQEERRNFLAFCDDCYTEELMEVHEKELKKWKNHYELSKSIFDCIAQREVLWKQMLDLETKARDPSRYVNRGGHLLQEEKERKKIRTLLPKLENDIHQLIQDFTERTKVSFRIEGLEFAEYCTRQWNQHNVEKENQKLKRQLKQTAKFMQPAKWSLHKLPQASNTLAPNPPHSTPIAGACGGEISSIKKRPVNKMAATTSRISRPRSRQPLRLAAGPQSAVQNSGDVTRRLQDVFTSVLTSTPRSSRNFLTVPIQPLNLEESLSASNFNRLLTDLTSSTSSHNNSKRKVLGSKLSPHFNNNGSIRSRKSIGQKRTSNTGLNSSSLPRKAGSSINRGSGRSTGFSRASGKSRLPLLY